MTIVRLPPLLIFYGLPASFLHARDLTLMSKITQANTA
ncbi:hypothetical protein IBB3154_1552 [Ligilactobacillus salivarius]|uniref:Uncharacterized protein n=2 Tax=Ligilactobacillus salivarius TaxID=1624 RepID=F7QSX5_9LACO|nr:hypothetical protein NIAS840_00393 [Ligilactobacillus salivarius NIAS840]EGM52142.1 hypothetical protein LSGJ_00562 [Ligilactobacillus salivarius GJ-24]QIG37018.1 hypothetical protein IBB3154_1552 [Ligilactobacillus salivarius]